MVGVEACRRVWGNKVGVVAECGGMWQGWGVSGRGSGLWHGWEHVVEVGACGRVWGLMAGCGGMWQGK